MGCQSMALRYKIKVRDVGGSRTITIPSTIAATEGIEAGDIVDVTLKKIEEKKE